MDIKARVPQEQEVARVLLIGISQSVPDKVFNSKHENGNLNDGTLKANGDVTELFRSELISISYAQPLDAKVLPVSLENYRG